MVELTTHFPNVTVFHQREQIGLTFHLSFVRKTELLPTSVTMALPNLWKIYASFRTPEEERQYSREAFFKFSGYIISCIVMTALASRGLGARQSAQLISSSVRN
ncbi:hypothetical protein INT43_008756 [Umbelopsis isabellina]|uniref:Uncharacterized protein n=1 Tax=Mortierella isabellina TaxID=91625 RepID=A0A8H7PXB6_MORIS|nr:hypothetical protein INT43_008756 [Umbelopsis isabellina]